MSRRISVLVILAAVLFGGLFIDRAIDDEAESPTEAVVDSTQFPIASMPGSLSSTWYCAGGTAEGDDPFANHIIDVLNPTEEPIEVTLTVYAGHVAPPPTRADPENTEETTAPTTTTAPPADLPEPVVQTFSVSPRTRQQAVLGELITAPIASALVEGSGGLIVEHEVVSQHGRDAKPCSSSASDTWHFAWGSTAVDARELLVLFNPFPDDAIVEGIFSTEAGIREPLRFGGLVVPGKGTIAVDLGDDVTRRDEVAATIRARSGRIVVDRIQRISGDRDRGLTVQTGVPAAQRQWVYPYGFASDSIREEFTVYNPTDQLAEVEIETVLADPAENGAVEPLQLSIPPGTHQRVDVAADDRIPDSVAHRSIVRSSNGVPVVAERVQYANGDSRRGISVTTGSPVEATTWFFAAGAANEATDEWLNIVNLDPQVLTEVSVGYIEAGRVTAVPEWQDIEIGPGGRLDLRLGEHAQRDALPLVITATEPVVVERGLYRTGDRGVSNAIGIPSPDGLRMPFDPFENELVLDDDLGDLEDAPRVGDDTDGPPTAPDDVELPEPDETIEVDDPDAEADIPGETTTTAAPTSTAAPTTTAPTTTAPG